MQDILEAILRIDILSPPREYTRQVLAILCTQLGYAFGIAFAMDTHGELVVFTHHATPEEYLACCTPASANTLGTGAVSDTRFTLGADILREHNVQAVTRIPLTHQQEMLGLYELYTAAAPLFTETDEHVLAQIAELAAVAISSNRYLEQLGQRTEELKEEILRRERVEVALREALRERKSLEEIIHRSPVVVFKLRAANDWPLELISRNIELYGYTQEEFYAGTVSLLDLLHPDDRRYVMLSMGSLGSREDFVTLEFRFLAQTGEYRWVEMRLWPEHNTDGYDLLAVVTDVHGRITHLQGVMIDITDRKHAEEIIHHQAFYDTLTDLPNRTLFQDRLSVALYHARRHNSKLAVMFLDLDQFKMINDTRGHAVGDQLLQAVALRFRGLLRAEDTVARVGGDEFAVIIPEISHTEDAANVAQKLLAAVHPPFTLGGQQVHVGVSIGISLFPLDGDDAQQLLKCADTALYSAKDEGRNTYRYFTAHMHAQTLQRMELQHHLLTALGNEEFQVYYQPQVHLTTGHIYGMESLLRWRHPELGMISPGQFIPLAEETGLIEEIGQWVLVQACNQVQRWHHEGLGPFKIAVNLSPRQFYQQGLIQTIEQALYTSHLPPHCLELEITEGTAMRDVDSSIRIMEALKAMDVRLSMDDFGIGYSSLTFLKKFPINTLKIDKSFIDGLNTDPQDTAIVTAIIAMARSLRLHVIAEGVETDEQLDFLCASHCDGIQGHLLCRAVPPDAIAPLLTASTSGANLVGRRATRILS